MSIKSIQQENGFTIVEIMVALVILSVGLMATAYMQTRSVQFGNESQNRSQINLVVSDMIDRMRSSMIQASTASSSTYTDLITETELSTSTCDHTSADPRNDVICFYNELATLVPTSNMQITIEDLDNNGSGDSYQITVYWSDQQLSQGNLDEDTVDGQAKEADCSGTSRTWSGDIAWPDPGRSYNNLCLVSHNWQFEVPVR